MANPEKLPVSLEAIQAEIDRLQKLSLRSPAYPGIQLRISTLQIQRFKLQYGTKEGVKILKDSITQTKQELETWKEANPVHSQFLQAWRLEKSHAYAKDNDHRGEIYKEAREQRIAIGKRLGIEEAHLQLIDFATSPEKLIPFFEKLEMPFNDDLLTTLTTLNTGESIIYSLSSLQEDLVSAREIAKGRSAIE